MEKIKKEELNDILSTLYDSSVSGTIEKSDDCFSAIKSFKSQFKQLNRSTDIIRIMINNEFNFEGYIDCFKLKLNEDKLNALNCEWYSSIFVIVDFSNVEAWIKKCIDEADKGKTVVALLPSRTNTTWFHDDVLDRANEVRFIKGKVIYSGHSTPSAFSDCLAIYKGYIKKKERNKGQVGIIKLATSFTSNENKIEASII